MTWVKLDDGFWDHPKVVDLSNAAFRSHVGALCYCGRYSPGVGHIPATCLKRLKATPSVVAELVAAGLWEEREDGLYIHDFEVYHPLPNGESKAEAGRLGGLAKARNARSKALARPSSVLLAKPSPVPTRPVPSTSDEVLPPSVVALSRPPPRVRVPLTEDQRSRLFADFEDLPYLAQRIEEAMAHRALDRAKSEYLYLRAWLRKDLERLAPQPKGGNSHGSTRGNPDADYARQVEDMVRRRNG